jgi:AcrR family transcriptional regulator
MLWSGAKAHATMCAHMTSRKIKTQPRKRPRQARASATVEAVLAAAAEVFEGEGFAAANVNKIAARAGVSVGSLYQYYPSKEALLVALIERHTEASLSALEHALAQTRSLPLDAAVRHVVRAMVDAHRAPLHQLLARELDEMGRLDPVQQAIDARAGRAVSAFLSARRRQIRVPDRDFAAFLLVRAVDLLTHAVVADRPRVLAGELLVDELSALVVGYLTAHRRKPHFASSLAHFVGRASVTLRRAVDEALGERRRSGAGGSPRVDREQPAILVFVEKVEQTELELGEHWVDAVGDERLRVHLEVTQHEHVVFRHGGRLWLRAAERAEKGNAEHERHSVHGHPLIPTTPAFPWVTERVYHRANSSPIRWLLAGQTNAWLWVQGAGSSRSCSRRQRGSGRPALQARGRPLTWTETTGQ